jgi:hypothetical protein
MANDKKYHRVQLSLAPSAYRLLMDLRNEIGAATATEVIRTALTTLKWIREMIRDGYEIALVKNGMTIPVGALLQFGAEPGSSANDRTPARAEKAELKAAGAGGR